MGVYAAGRAVEHAPSAQVHGVEGMQSQHAGDSQVEEAVAVLLEARAAVRETLTAVWSWGTSQNSAHWKLSAQG